MCRPYSAREKLIHAMSLDTDRPTSRAEVVGCAISATLSHAQLFEITHVANIKSVQPSCQNAEVVEAFCRVAASRTIPVDQFASPSVAALRAPAEIAPPAFSSVRRYADMTSPRTRVAPIIKSGAEIKSA
jgi:hypothetical protein